MKLFIFKIKFAISFKMNCVIEQKKVCRNVYIIMDYFCLLIHSFCFHLYTTIIRPILILFGIQLKNFVALFRETIKI